MAKRRKKAKKPNEFSSRVEVCCHQVSFRYDLEDHKIPEDVEEFHRRLADEAEERAKAMIVEGCHCGDLNCLYVYDDGSDDEIRGWWEIDNS